jgi:hypothetical protein
VARDEGAIVTLFEQNDQSSDDRVIVVEDVSGRVLDRELAPAGTPYLKQYRIAPGPYFVQVGDQRLQLIVLPGRTSYLTLDRQGKLSSVRDDAPPERVLDALKYLYQSGETAYATPGNVNCCVSGGRGH